MSSISQLSSAYNAILSTNTLKKNTAAQIPSTDADATVAKTREKDAAAATAADNKPTLTVALFPDMYNSRVMAAVDTNGDQKISKEEYSAQIRASGGSQSRADAMYKKMDKDSDGTVSAQEFTDSIASPFAKDGYAQKIAQLIEQIQGGQSTAPFSGTVLDADGKVSQANSDQILRNMVQEFPGNI
ncbi:EF-hand domain-containing protein [Undibacterium terreum]|uniref:EF-hand domain-containing protein n=1 Tax=Undibacterium terreum TaxID=1224302 RepID=A0A916V0B3_9BURK|nr:EF-hand domain-containing protein [Undibacterium terreum]GGC97907.1 hypothetical protein GCM10011396_51800 [Undibacterium terreum]